jgi:hypothetical protein
MKNYLKVKVFNLYGGSGAATEVTDSLIRQQAINAAIYVKRINPNKTFEELGDTPIMFNETPGYDEQVVDSDFDTFIMHFDNKLRELFRNRREMDP